jgi:hypothetical protein
VFRRYSDETYTRVQTHKLHALAVYRYDAVSQLLCLCPLKMFSMGCSVVCFFACSYRLVFVCVFLSCSE